MDWYAFVFVAMVLPSTPCQLTDTQRASLQLQEFKKGPFYLREDINKNIVPAIVFGAYELWPPGRLFALPGKVLCRRPRDRKSC